MGAHVSPLYGPGLDVDKRTRHWPLFSLYQIMAVTVALALSLTNNFLRAGSPVRFNILDSLSLLQGGSRYHNTFMVRLPITLHRTQIILYVH